MKKLLRALVALTLALVSLPVGSILAATTADVSVTATPAFVSISVSPDNYGYGVVSASATPSTTTSYFTITNSSTVVTDNTIAVTTATWAGGVTWTHSDTATPGSDTVGLSSNKGGTWGVGDVIVKYNSPNILADDQAATTNWSFGLKLYAPTAFTDGVQKSVTVRVSASAA